MLLGYPEVQQVYLQVSQKVAYIAQWEGWREPHPHQVEGNSGNFEIYLQSNKR
jgi:hypothetical protein